MENYYKILNVPKDASTKEIISSYRKLAQRYHPDHNPGFKEAAEEMFKKIQQAKEILTDDGRRRAYNRDLEIFERSVNSASGYNSDNNSANSSTRGDSDKTYRTHDTWSYKSSHNYENKYSKTNQSDNPAPKGGRDIHITAEVSFYDAYYGKYVKVTIPNCQRTIAVKIPSRSHNGLTLRIAGQGESGEDGGGAGNLFVNLQVIIPWPYRVEGDDIHIDYVYGAGKDITLPEILLSFRIPDNINQSIPLRLVGMGLKNTKTGGVGNLYVHSALANEQSIKNEDIHIAVYVGIYDIYYGSTISVPIKNTSRIIELDIPTGIRPGQVLRVRGFGKKYLPGDPGDLYIEINLNKDTRYKIEGDDLHVTMAMRPGEIIELPELSISIKAPVDTKEVLSLPGRGLKNIKTGEYGTLYVHQNSCCDNKSKGSPLLSWWLFMVVILIASVIYNNTKPVNNQYNSSSDARYSARSTKQSNDNYSSVYTASVTPKNNMEKITKTLDEMVPNWRVQNKDEGFLLWLEEKDPNSDDTRQTKLEYYFKNGMYNNVVYMFLRYRREEGKTYN